MKQSLSTIKKQKHLRTGSLMSIGLNTLGLLILNGCATNSQKAPEPPPPVAPQSIQIGKMYDVQNWLNDVAAYWLEVKKSSEPTKPKKK